MNIKAIKEFATDPHAVGVAFFGHCRTTLEALSILFTARIKDVQSHLRTMTESKGPFRTDVARRWCNAEDVVKELYKYIPTFYLQK